MLQVGRAVGGPRKDPGAPGWQAAQGRDRSGVISRMFRWWKSLLTWFAKGKEKRRKKEEALRFLRSINMGCGGVGPGYCANCHSSKVMNLFKYVNITIKTGEQFKKEKRIGIVCIDCEIWTADHELPLEEWSSIGVLEVMDVQCS